MEILLLLRFVSNKTISIKTTTYRYFTTALSWMPSAIVIAQSIAKILAPTCFQNEAPVFEHVFEHILDQHVFKTHWNSKIHSKTHSKTGASF